MVEVIRQTIEETETAEAEAMVARVKAARELARRAILVALPPFDIEKYEILIEL